MRIDSHHHFWNPETRDYPWMTGDALEPIRRAIGPEDLRPELAAAGIDGTVLVQTVHTLEETREFLNTADATDFVKGVVGWVDLTDPDVGDTLDTLLAGPGGRYLKGIRHQAHDEADENWLARPDVISGVAACGERGLVQDLLSKEPELPACITLVDMLPDVTFVLDHISKPRIAAGEMEPWRALIVELARRDNVVCKLSGMITEADWQNWTVDDLRPYVDIVLEAFGTDRLMFGSDWPVCLLAGGYSEVVQAAEAVTSQLSPAEQENVFGNTAIRIYGLEA
ncbi:MAG: amidohydrolase family protein [Pseudomonadota bacterium]